MNGEFGKRKRDCTVSSIPYSVIHTKQIFDLQQLPNDTCARTDL